MMDSSMAETSKGRAPRALWLIVLLSLSCKQENPEPRPTITSTWTDDVLRVVKSDPAPRVEVVVTRDVPYRMQSVTSSSGAPEFQVFLGGEELEFVGGTVKIGDRTLGPFDEPTLVEVKPEGVFVNKKLSGPLSGE